MNSRAVKIVVSLLLATSLLCCSISVFATDPTPEPTDIPYDDGLAKVDEKLLSYYVWLCMRAWGIEISYQESVEFNDYVEEQINNWIIEYLNSLPSAYTISQWIAPWQSSFDYWGNYRFNSSALEDIQDFVDWLINQFGLSNNDEVVLNASYTANGAQVYYSNTWYSADYQKSNVDYMAFARSTELSDIGTSETPWFFVIHNPYNDYYYLMFIRPVGSGIAMPTHYVGLSSSGQKVGIQTDSSNWSGLTKDNYEFCLVIPYPDADPNNAGGITIPNNTTYLEYYSTQTNRYNYTYGFLNSIDSFTVNQIGDTKIVTTDIVLPDDAIDYSPGDSVTIVDNTPNYSIIEWSGEVTVSNLPAIVSTGTIANPELDQIYNYIPGFIEETSESINGFRQILFLMPDEVLLTLYALLASGVIFGFLRIMREH